MEGRSILIETFGDSPRMRVLDFVLNFESFDYPKSHVARVADVSRTTLDPIWDELVEEGIVVKTRTVGRAEMYELNVEHPTVCILRELALRLASRYADEEEERIKQRITVKKRRA